MGTNDSIKPPGKTAKKKAAPKKKKAAPKKKKPARKQKLYRAAIDPIGPPG